MIFAVRLFDREIIDGSQAQAHESFVIKLPVFVSVGAKPAPGVVAPLVGEAHGDAILGEGPQLLNQAVIEFLAPLARQERDDFLPSVDELRAESPVEPSATRSGVRGFQLSSAARTFRMAVSLMNGGTRGVVFAGVLMGYSF